jgi:uncharacterized protein YjiS (DUF1127 family)
MAAPAHPLRSASSVQALGRGWLPPKFAEIRTVLGAWRLRYRFRRELERLMSSAPHLIADLGLSRELAARDVAKPFWRA